MRIAISGKSGCGNTTVSSLVAKKLGFPMINFTFRNLSQEKGIDFWVFCDMAQKDDSIDRELDSRQVKMAMAQDSCVLGSRLAIWMLKDADLKVYLAADEYTRARRVYKREGGDFASILQQTRHRDASDTERYKRIYGIDNNDSSIADLVIDAGSMTPEQIADLIIEKASLTVQKKHDVVK
ncbi:MAG: AAA family ATPase [Sphaerochaetaceae bacterium]|jgi:cytidylate kinase|nr:AAA family ATPase [Sphaerochaetaceae bacterium]MDD3163060.1 AAA family ATPase [Sphaerochaetaceae bacterium]MDD4006596.1 AAA family ATPase [Sphaerochaetaceae bacterium]MDD4396651.1 AAA family ATPase [Sphaerochaetaceae bacterium]